MLKIKILTESIKNYKYIPLLEHLTSIIGVLKNWKPQNC